MSKKLFENNRHKITREAGNGPIDAIFNSLIGLDQPVKITVRDKKTGRSGSGTSRNAGDAERQAWRELRSKNNSR